MYKLFAENRFEEHISTDECSQNIPCEYILRMAPQKFADAVHSVILAVQPNEYFPNIAFF